MQTEDKAPSTADGHVCSTDELCAAKAALPKITHVAIQYAGRVWSLPAPNRHHHIIRMIAKETGDGIRGPDTQGFLSDTGIFLRRSVAYRLAKKNGQLKRAPGGYAGTDLYSEDLW